MGRFLVAVRSLAAGEVVLREAPLLEAPPPSTPPVCLACYRQLVENNFKDCPRYESSVPPARTVSEAVKQPLTLHHCPQVRVADVRTRLLGQPQTPRRVPADYAEAGQQGEPGGARRSPEAC